MRRKTGERDLKERCRENGKKGHANSEGGVGGLGGGGGAPVLNRNVDET